jgi:hypothetical protein
VRRLKPGRLRAEMPKKPLKNAPLTLAGDCDEDSGGNARKVIENASVKEQR